MVYYVPSRSAFGDELHSQLAETQVAHRLGDRALVITGPEREQDGSLEVLKNALSRAGIVGAICDTAAEYARSDVVADMVSLIQRSKAQWVLGFGGPATLSIAKTAALVAGLGPAVSSVDSVLDSGAPPVSDFGTAYPVVAVPTASWNPLVYGDMAVVTDSRDRNARLLKTGIYADCVLHSTQFLKFQTEKQLVYDLLCILLTCIEALPQLHARMAVTAPLVLSVLDDALRLLRELPSSDEPPSSVVVQLLGLNASRSTSAFTPGPATAAGWAIYGQFDITLQWVSAALLPGASSYAASRGVEADPGFLENFGALFGADDAENAVDAVQLIEDDVRSLAGMADIPIRLRDFGIDIDDVSSLALTTGRICDEDTIKLTGMLEDAH